MAAPSGSRIGHFEVVAALGAGGMGEVYQARDTKLDRDVALKLLPDTFAADPERLRRFEREAKTLASLNHPHIAQIYGVVDVDDRQALVMELVPGQTLDVLIQAAASRSGQGLPLPEAVAIAAQIAEALEAAHEAGIVHRDLKPANVMIRHDDVVKVLDFGLARAADPALSGAAENAASPTVMSPAVTGHGVIVGTASYMSPEQAKGRTADKRSDIWSYGVVLYEMLAGRRLFSGETVTEVIAAVLRDMPSLDALPSSTPAALRRVIERCLERDPRLRLRDIGEARIALARINDPADVPAAPPARRVPRTLAYVGGILAAAVLAALATWTLKPGGVAVPVRRFDLPRAIAAATTAALSPDGQQIAYASRGRLYVHALQTGTATELGVIPTETGEVFWSPDGQTIGINVESAIRTIPAAGGAFFTVCTVPGSGVVMSARWRPDNTILFSVWRDSLYRVTVSGGTPQLEIPIDPQTEVDFHSIANLPDGRLALAVHLRGSDRVQLSVVENGRREPVAGGQDVNSVRLQPSGRLLFLRVGANEGVWAARLAGRTIDLTKALLLEPGAVSFDAASDSLMANFAPKDRRELVWMSRAGVATEVPGAPFDTSSGAIALSPDGGRAVLAMRGPNLTGYFVVRDLATGADTRVPLPQAPSIMVSGSGTVSWTPSQRLLYATGGIESWRLYDWPSDGSTGWKVIADGLSAKMTADGAEVFYLHDERGTYRLLHAKVQPEGTLGPPAPVFADGDMRVRGFDVSPDGRLLAFTQENTDTQLLNVVVTTLPDLRERRQVTAAGRLRPVFSRDGRELYFLSEDRAPGSGSGRLSVVDVAPSPFTIGVPKPLFALGGAGRPSMSGFDVAADGRLLMTRSAPQTEGDEPRAVLRQNWMAALAW